MKFITYSYKEQNRTLGVLINNNVYNVQDLDTTVPNNMEEFILDSKTNLNKIRTACNNELPKNSLSENDVILHAPIQRPGSVRDFMAFEDHLLNTSKITGMNVSPQWYEIPAFYFTNHRTIQGPEEVINRPPDCVMLDYELEIAIIIGSEGKNISVDKAEEHIFGYMIFNDWSARDLQLPEMPIGLGPVKGKDFATSIGPYIVTKDEIESKRDKKGFNLEMTATVNGKEISRGNLNSIYYSFNEMIERASRGVTLYPGDIIGSGTVGTGSLLEFGPDVHPWLADGDEVSLTIEKLGTLKNKIES